MHFDTLNPAKIMVVDDHPMIREGIKLLLGRESYLDACFETQDPKMVLEELSFKEYHLIILDLSLGDQYSYDLIRDLNKLYPKLSILIFSMHEETVFAERVLRLGAKGYLMKQEATEALLLAVQEILRGETYISNRMRTLFVKQVLESKVNSEPSLTLTMVETQIFEEIGKGLSNLEISQKFGRSVKTIEAHRTNIRRKLNLFSGRDLNRYATQWVEKNRKMGLE